MIIEGAIAVVTGAARGIGLAICEALACNGAHPVLVDRDADLLALAQTDLAAKGFQSTSCVCDVTDDAAVVALASDIEGRFGRVDLLVNNAGVGLGGPIETISIDDWRWLIEINILGTVRGLHAFLPGMLAAGRGHIVNVASSVGLFADAPQAIPYVTSKTAIVGMSRALRLHLAPRGIGVSLLCPDNTDTGFRDRAKVVGMDRATVVASLPPTGFQSADQVAGALVAGLRADRFLISMTPGFEARLLDEARALAQL